MTVNAAHDVPAVSFKAFGGIVSEPALNITVDRNAVVIIEGNQFTQFQGTGQRTGLVGDPFHHTAVAHKDVGVMINNIVPRTVELRRQCLFRNSKTDCVCDTLA